MAIHKADLFHVEVPLRTRVKHASHDRTMSDSLVVRVTLDDGTVGYGEGLPRPYVTGESIASTFAALSGLDLARAIGRPAEFEAVVRRLEALNMPGAEADPRGMQGNSARCALESAVLDAYGRRFGRNVGDAVRLVSVPGLEFSARPTRVRYSGAITAQSPAEEYVSAWKMWLFAFHQVKLKVGVAGQDDRNRLRVVRSVVGKKVDIRLDANEAWPASELAERVRPLLPYRPSALEQPVPHGEVGRLAGVRGKLGVPLMLDESLCGYPDAVRAVEEGTADLFNVRLSKCGGIIPALRIIGLARRSGLGVQLGCHPGETGLLSAAGRHLASNVRGLRYVEGSYDRYILARNLTADDPTFGYGGWATPLTGPGLGVEVDPAALEEMAVDRKEVVYD
jgi:L-alanine-DL-glutamate epimerase-like enolase superfamily enzyme